MGTVLCILRIVWLTDLVCCDSLFLTVKMTISLSQLLVTAFSASLIYGVLAQDHIEATTVDVEKVLTSDQKHEVINC